MVKLNVAKLLGFRIAGIDKEVVTGPKAGTKVGKMVGLKAGLKSGLKAGSKVTV